jgi:hypothetical protein
MNFHNFSVRVMLMKFDGECPGTLRLLRKKLFLLFDTFYYDLLIMQKISLFGLWILCREFL